MDITPFVDELAHQNVGSISITPVMPASTPARCSMFTGRFQLQLMYVPITMCVTLIMRKTW